MAYALNQPEVSASCDATIPMDNTHKAIPAFGVANVGIKSSRCLLSSMTKVDCKCACEKYVGPWMMSMYNAMAYRMH